MCMLVSNTLLFCSVDPKEETPDASCAAFFGPEEGNTFNLRSQHMSSLAGKLIRVDPVTGKFRVMMQCAMCVFWLVSMGRFCCGVAHQVPQNK